MKKVLVDEVAGHLKMVNIGAPPLLLHSPADSTLQALLYRRTHEMVAGGAVVSGSGSCRDCLSSAELLRPSFRPENDWRGMLCGT